MIHFPNGGRLVQDVSELPDIPQVISRLYLDLETTSRNPKLDSLNPWYHCYVGGIAVTWDDMSGAYYVPVGHADQRWNLPRDAVIRWVKKLLDSSKTWVNHHVKYDSHAITNDLGVDFSGERVCTIVCSKILDSDRQFRGGYGLDALSETWLHENINAYEDQLKRHIGKSKDYGVCPADVMGEYACQDVLTNRRLDHYLTANLPAESKPVIDVETRLTSLLIKMERRGLMVKPAELTIEKLFTLQRMTEIEQELHKLVGFPFLPTSSKDCFDVLCNTYGLPVISWTENDDGTKGNPSFDKEALEMYRTRIDSPKQVVELMLEYRKKSTFKGLFLDTYQVLATEVGDGYSILHPNHNQCVRTGRMSVSEPNSQQLDKHAKTLIHPGKGMSYMSADGSQIEFRTLAHYVQDDDIINAYIADPDVDFHQRVADMCGIKRRPAKTVNFSIAFGQGKKSTVALLEVDEDIVSAIKDAVNKLVDSGQLHPDGRDSAFKALARQKGEALYDRYHETFPNIRAVARQACNVAKSRGYVRNVLGRRRHLPENHAHKAFNTLNQSSAADIIKERMVTLADHLEGTGIELVTQVHDELVMVGPTEVFDDPRTARDIVAILEDVHVLRVPVRFRYGISDKNWKEAAGQEKAIPLDEVKRAGRLEHLK